jgi:hypothetical protein
MIKELLGSSRGGANGSAFHSLNVDLLCDCKSVVDLDTEISHRAFDF